MHPQTFSHERLEAYVVAVELLGVADSIACALPRGRAHLADQLRRAAISIPLNIAEGAGEFAAADKARFYRIARRSATECAAIVDVCRCLSLADPDELAAGRALLWRVVSMLTALVLRLGGAEQRAEAAAP
jgi:four helix bundle protein